MLNVSHTWKHFYCEMLLANTAGSLTDMFTIAGQPLPSMAILILEGDRY